jgi:PadR family transcriptional regulator AphA
MSVSSIGLRYVILGLLARRPMTGYDIKLRLKSLDWLVGSPSSGSLYPVLRALLAEGLVDVEVIPGVDKPPRKIYSLSRSGREALQAWTNEPVVSDASLKGFVMRLLLAASLPPARLIEHLQHRRKQVMANQRALEQAAGERQEGCEPGSWLALDYGLALAAAELDWLETMLDRLSGSPLPEETVHSKRLA